MSPEGSTVEFRGLRRPLPRRAIRSFARRLEREVAGGRFFHCLIAGDGELRRLNRQFLGKDYVTDVLSFPLAGGGVPGHTAGLGDIAISADRAVDQARAFGHPVETEIAILMLHGVLHLIGMDHETDRGRMVRAERRWRGCLQLPSGVIERARS